jgi:hypothetical protein
LYHLYALYSSRTLARTLHCNHFFEKTRGSAQFHWVHRQSNTILKPHKLPTLIRNDQHTADDVTY